MKEIVSYLTGSFNDYKGIEHKIVLCAVSCKEEGELYLEEYYAPILTEKCLRIGIAICNPIDKYDSSKGEFIAYNRAKSENAMILSTTHPGIINTDTVNCILNNILNYVTRDPGSVIKGYDEAKERFFEKADLRDDIAKMSKDEIEFVKILASTTPESIEYAKKVCKLLKDEN